jgi:hypothetical protein
MLPLVSQVRPNGQFWQVPPTHAPDGQSLFAVQLPEPAPTQLGTQTWLCVAPEPIVSQAWPVAHATVELQAALSKQDPSVWLHWVNG